MSEAVERRLVALLDNPSHCPHGNPIPGLEELGADATPDAVLNLRQLGEAAVSDGRRVVVRRISEHLQSDADLLRQLKDNGIQPGREVTATAAGGLVSVDGVELPPSVTEHIFVTVA